MGHDWSALRPRLIEIRPGLEHPQRLAQGGAGYAELLGELFLGGSRSPSASSPLTIPLAQRVGDQLVCLFDFAAATEKTLLISTSPAR